MCHRPLWPGSFFARALRTVLVGAVWPESPNRIHAPRLHVFPTALTNVETLDLRGDRRMLISASTKSDRPIPFRRGGSATSTTPMNGHEECPGRCECRRPLRPPHQSNSQAARVMRYLATVPMSSPVMPASTPAHEARYRRRINSEI